MTRSTAPSARSTPPSARSTAPSARRLPVIPLALLLSVTLIASMVVSLAFGSESLNLSGVIDVMRQRLVGRPGPDPVYDVIVWDLRVPRVLIAALVGAGLALAGAAMQTLVRNPLADPYLFGISAGAGVGATLVLVVGSLGVLGVWALSVGALFGALGASLLVFGIAMSQGGLSPLRLVLTGVVMSSAFTSTSSFLIFVAGDPRATQSVLFWLLGSFEGAMWSQVLPTLITLIVCAVTLFAMHSWLDALATGADTAGALGVPVRQMRITLFVLIAVLVGVLVAFSGGIGFVGLIVPHLARLLVGPRHQAMLPISAIGGALFLVWVDLAARTLVAPATIPLSVVTGLIGAPVFLILLGRRSYGYGGQQ